jgi:hypothetical protein
MVVARAARVRSRPEGKASSRWITTASGTTLTITPGTLSTGVSVLASPAISKLIAPATSRAPMRLLGRRHHATSPATA